MNKKQLTDKIRKYIASLNFDAYRIIPADSVDEIEQKRFQKWLAQGYHSSMDYMERNIEKRLDPRILVKEAKSIIVFALNYYPQYFQTADKPQIAYYAYGNDYHEVIKNKLKSLYNYCSSLSPDISGRYFCDTAPMLERYWATKAKLGWIGKHSLLIIPRHGSYYFLASFVLNIELEYDDIKEQKLPDCVNCTRCMDACPTGAIVDARVIDANRCLSYQTIENKGDIPESLISRMNNRFYGCDICQQVCPWNRFATGNEVEEFQPKIDLLNLTAKDWEEMSTVQYQRMLKGSAMKRAKFSGLKRNIQSLNRSKKL